MDNPEAFDKAGHEGLFLQLFSSLTITQNLTYFWFHTFRLEIFMLIYYTGIPTSLFIYINGTPGRYANSAICITCRASTSNLDSFKWDRQIDFFMLDVLKLLIFRQMDYFI